MRQYSESERSSAFASFESARYKSCCSRSGNCSVHLSFMIDAQKDRHGHQARPGCEVPAADAGRREKRMIEAGISGRIFRLAIGATQVSPIDIRSQVFAADGAGCRALDLRTAFSGHWPGAGNPLADCRRRDADGTRKRGLAASNRTSYENRFFFHVPIIRRRLTICNRNCLMSFKRGKLGDA